MIKLLDLIRVSTFAVLFLISSLSLAAGQGYIGGGVGQSSTAAPGFEDGTSVQLFGGYMFTPNFGLEIGFTDLGEFDLTGGPAGSNAAVDGFYGALVGAFPVGKGGVIKGKLGLYSWDFNSSGPGIAADTDGTEVMYGIGFDYFFNNNFGLGIEYDVYADVRQEDVDAIWINLLFKFTAN